MCSTIGTNTTHGRLVQSSDRRRRDGMLLSVTTVLLKLTG